MPIPANISTEQHGTGEPVLVASEGTVNTTSRAPMSWGVSTSAGVTPALHPFNYGENGYYQHDITLDVGQFYFVKAEQGQMYVQTASSPVT